MTLGLLGMVLAFVLSWVTYPLFIKFLKQTTAEQKVSEYALDEFKDKQKTVTFGGVPFVLIPIAMTLVLMIQQLNIQLILLMVLFFGYGLLGLVDDYKIIKEGKNDGLSAKSKLLVQFLLATFFYFVYTKNGGNTDISVPLTDITFEMGVLYLPFVAFMLVAYSNAVNLTDGMDGLATGTTIIALVPLALFAYLKFDTPLFVFLLTVIGALVGFLVFNYKPAKIFMGDVGSLALGALFAISSVYLKIEILSLLIGGVFVFETVTVVIQQISYRLFRKRVFKYTPIHYSFTLSGWKEVRVVHLFWFMGLVCALLGTWIGLI